MKIKLYSDLHIEFEAFMPPESEEHKDVILVLAGDICPLERTMAKHFLLMCASEYKEVIYVPGNHEYYHGKVYQSWTKMKEKIEAESDNVHMLDNETKVIDGVAFIGSTLWADFGKGNPVVMQQAAMNMNDFKVIKKVNNDQYQGKLRVIDVLGMHQEAKNFILSEIPKYEKSVVVTHFGPSYLSVNQKFVGDPLNGYYVSELGNEIAELQPSHWFHGHSHDSVFYYIGDTKVMSNPKGYYDENPEFSPEMILEI